MGLCPTHSLAFVDNTAAEHVAENGRTTADALHALNLRRQQRLVAEGIHQATARVTSIDNDVADLISRGRTRDRREKNAELDIRANYLRTSICLSVSLDLRLPFTAPLATLPAG